VRDDQDQSDALERYWMALAQGNDTPPRSVAPELIDVVNRLQTALSPPAPSHAFRQQLSKRIDQHLQQHDVPSRGKRNWHRHRVLVPAGTLAAVAVIVAGIFIGSGVLSPRPHVVSAAEILHRAQAVTIASTGGGIRSFKLTEQTVIRPGNSGLGGFARMTSVVRITSQRWYRAPNRWRTERRYQSLPANPLVRNSYEYPTLEVSDGKTFSSYDARGGSIERYSISSGQSGIYDLLPFGHGATSVTAILHSYHACYAPRLRGRGQVAGRAVFIVDLGPTRCQSNSAHVADGRLVLSIDRNTFLVLKSVLYDVSNSALPYIINAITRINYNVSIPDSTFTFERPTVKPVPVSTPIPIPQGATVAQLRRLLPFPIFVPTHSPPGLTPRAPQVEPGVNQVVSIDYRDTHGRVTLSLVDGATFCCIDNDPRKYGIRVQLGPRIMAHLLDYGAGFGGLDLWWEEHGAFIAISGPHLTKTELVQIACSMSQTAVPRGS